MIRKNPMHDVVTPPGQIVPVKTLGDYIEKVNKAENPPKKLTFDEWYASPSAIEFDPYYQPKEMLRIIWNVAQENK